MIRDYDLHLALTPSQEAEISSGISQWMDAQRLLHLHPHWFIEQLENRNGLWNASIRDYADNSRFSLSFKLSFGYPDLVVLDFQEGPFESIRIACKNHRLTAQVQFKNNADESEPSETLNFNLQLWLRSVRAYLNLHVSRSVRSVMNRLLMDHVLLKMNPSQRKISVMILRFTFLEVILIVAIIIGFVLTR